MTESNSFLESFLIELFKKMMHKVTFDSDRKGICFIDKNLNISVFNNDDDIFILFDNKIKKEYLKVKDFEIKKLMDFLSKRATYSFNLSLRIENEELVNEYDNLLNQKINNKDKYIIIAKKKIEIFDVEVINNFLNFKKIEIDIPNLGKYVKYVSFYKENKIEVDLTEKFKLFLDNIEDIEEVSKKVSQYKLYMDLNKDIKNNNKKQKSKI